MSGDSGAQKLVMKINWMLLEQILWTWEFCIFSHCPWWMISEGHVTGEASWVFLSPLSQKCTQSPSLRETVVTGWSSLMQLQLISTKLWTRCPPELVSSWWIFPRLQSFLGPGTEKTSVLVLHSYGWKRRGRSGRKNRLLKYLYEGTQGTVNAWVGMEWGAMSGRVSAPWKRLSRCCGVACGELSTEGAGKHWWHSTQIIKFTICKYVFPKERERVSPQKEKHDNSRDKVLPNLRQIHTAYSCFLRKATLGLWRSSAFIDRQRKGRIAW